MPYNRESRKYSISSRRGEPKEDNGAPVSDQKSNLKGLNHQLEQYIQRVKDLEAQNAALKDKLEKAQASKPKTVDQQCLDDLGKLRNQILSFQDTKDRAEIQTEALRDQSDQWRDK